MTSTKPYTMIVSRADGDSAFEDHILTLEERAVVDGTPPFQLAVIGGGGAVFLRSDGFDSEPHPAPRRQWVLMLKGSIEVEVSDGSRRRFGPGELILVTDVAGRGHLTTAVGEGPFEGLFLPQADDA